MPADAETSREIGEITSRLQALDDSVHRLESKVETSSEQSREEARRVYERVESHAREAADQARRSAEAVAIVDRKITLVTSELHAHTEHDGERFARQERQIEEAARDRGKWWRALVGVAGGGGLGAAIARWLDGGGP